MHGFHAEKSQEQLVLDALEPSVGSPRRGSWLKDKQKIVIVTSDHTRPLPSKITLPLRSRRFAPAIRRPILPF